MKRIPPIPTYTQAQLQRRINQIRLSYKLLASKTLNPKHVVGTHRFLDTEVGRVGVLIYNFEKKETLPLFINIHGSGFVMGSANMDDHLMMNVALSADVKIISIDYSLAPDHPFPRALEECYGVTLYARTHPEEFGIDPDRIVIGGHSAGGNLSAGVCLMDRERQLLSLKGLILDYPPMDLYTDPYDKPQPKGALPPGMCRMFDACYCNDRQARKNPLLSPFYTALEQLSSFPPTLVITAEGDSLNEEAEVYKDNLIKAGVDVTFKRFAGVPHGFNLKPGPESDESWRLIIEHLKHCLH